MTEYEREMLACMKSISNDIGCGTLMLIVIALAVVATCARTP